jgi:putative DNA primase/helicase
MVEPMENVIPLPLSAADYGEDSDGQDQDSDDGPPSRLSVRAMAGGPLPLGYDHDRHFYFSMTKRQIIELTPSEHTEMRLRSIARYDWYHRNFKGASATVPWKIVADSMMRLCEQAGIYSPDRIRGRGVHRDGDSIVIHLGDRLIVDGERHDPGYSPVDGSNLIYEQSEALNLNLEDALSDDEALQYFELINRCSWGGSQGVSGSQEQAILAAGWAVVAPICGVLQRRPTLWVVGESGAGKTWFHDNLLHPAIGPMLVRVSLKTTEPGLRRDLHPDALPVAFNEAEARDRKGEENLQRIIETARASYDEHGAKIVMGNQNGGVDRFQTRSLFAFLSIGHALRDTADANRTCVITMKKGLTSDEFDRLGIDVANLVDGTFAGRMIARTFSMIPIILKNIETFADALVKVTGDRRIADTMAPFLAGYAALRSRKLVRAPAALKIVSEHRWIGDRAQEAKEQAIPDHRRIINRIMQAMIPIGSGAERKSIAELISLWQTGDAGSTVPNEETLKRHGMRVDMVQDGWLLRIAKRHAEMERIFFNTAWASTWEGILSGHYEPIVKGKSGQQRFSGGIRYYTIDIPMREISGD